MLSRIALPSRNSLSTWVVASAFLLATSAAANPTDPEKCSCAFPGGLPGEGEAYSVDVEVRSNLDLPVAESFVDLYLEVESGRLDAEQVTAVEAVTDDTGRITLGIPGPIRGDGVIHFAVWANGYFICTSDSYAIGVVPALPATWGAVKAMFAAR